MNKTFEKCIGIIGNPMNPDVAWSDEQLLAMKEIGIDTLQLSIAWSSKPANEVLNMEDLDNPLIAKIYKTRVEKAHHFGLKALAHFGIPKTIHYNQLDATACISDPEVVEKYRKRLIKFFKEYDADEVMIYTYDQWAWLCSEFGDCPRCKGVPLYERLVPFLQTLVDAVQEGKPGARLWWEPWELSEGQIIEVIERIKPDHFGIIMHNSIAEVHFTYCCDMSFRNIARLAVSKGIPFVGEGHFGGSGDDIQTIDHMPCPRLVYQQLYCMHNTTGVIGIKEYYGFVPAYFSVNIAMFSSYLQSPEEKLYELLEQIVEPYGGGKSLLLEAWEMVSQGMELFPFNANWWLRGLLADFKLQEIVKLPTADWETP
ncbi:MAG: hypothetical protein ACYDIA_14020, partial [Candidatus Humimicrobiaceae bacterium]